MTKFSIILPVRNGGEYVKECVNSILAQSYQDFNLLVLDNNSTDGTLEWVQSITDNRIKIYPSQKSLSIEESWGRIISIPKNEFITLIGHDDILYSNYLETMDKLISSYPDAGLYQTHFTYIDTDGREIRNCKPMAEIESAEDFLTKFLRNEIDVMGSGFMMRSKDYDLLGGIPAYPNLLFADFELWINLCKTSYKATSGNTCFSFRLHQSTTSVSSDLKFHQSFGQFIFFLKKLMEEQKNFNEVVKTNAGTFIMFYCRGLSHRLLRTPRDKRNGLTVSGFVLQCKDYSKMLGIEDMFRPEKVFSILIAKLLDNSSFGRGVFRVFKKIYGKPIMK